MLNEIPVTFQFIETQNKKVIARIWGEKMRSYHLVDIIIYGRSLSQQCAYCYQC